MAALAVLAEARTAAEFHAAMPAARAATRPFLADLDTGRVPAEDLAVSITVTRDPDDYRANTTAAALRQLRRAGIDVQPGRLVRYVVQRGRPGIPAAQRVAPLDLLQDHVPVVDRSFYRQRLEQSLDDLLPAAATVRR